MMDITTLPYRAEPLFLGALTVTGLLWITLSLYVVLNRRSHDRRQRRLMEAARDLSDPAVASLPPLDIWRDGAHWSPRPWVPGAYPTTGVLALAPLGTMTVPLTVIGAPVAEVDA